MGRKKTDAAEILKHDIKTRVNEHHYSRLLKLLEGSRCRTMSDLLREIICKGKLTIYTKDDSLSVVMHELVKIRKELNYIGNNINQVTRQINSATNRGTKFSLIVEVGELCREVEKAQSELFPVISALAKKWLQK